MCICVVVRACAYVFEYVYVGLHVSAHVLLPYRREQLLHYCCVCAYVFEYVYVCLHVCAYVCVLATMRMKYYTEREVGWESE